LELTLTTSLTEERDSLSDHLTLAYYVGNYTEQTKNDFYNEEL